MSFTYDIATDIGRTRLFAADTDISSSGANATFTDEELQYFLSISGSVPALAASYALEAVAADAARLAQMVDIRPVKIDARDLSKALADRAEKLRGIAAGLIPESVLLPSGSVPDRIFSTDADNGLTVGTMTGW